MTTQRASVPSTGAVDGDIIGPPSPSMIVVGKDVLELLSSAMYVDPLSIYREYVQNAADAIDEARDGGVLTEYEPGEVSITVNAQARHIIIRDNGSGIAVAHAGARLLAIGASSKRGTLARGFRGVGRLAGLAYGRALTFRTRAVGDDRVVQLRWDCQRLKAALRDVTESDDISSVIQRVVTISLLDGAEWPEHFFEVEMSDVIRTKRDALLSSVQISHYLEQVAPVPFGQSLGWASEIKTHLEGVRLGNVEIKVNGEAALRRPLTDVFKVTDTVSDSCMALELATLTDLDGGVAAKGWILHHGYRGSITARSRIAGLRARVGNVQIGDEKLLDDVFPEARFNGWCIGELHILDPRIVPNARRDHFEQNVHFSNLTAQLEPLGRQISKRARTASISRNRARAEELAAGTTPGQPQIAAPAQADLTVNTQESVQTSVLSSKGLSPRQRMTLKRVRAVLGQSGLSANEIAQVIGALRDTERFAK